MNVERIEGKRCSPPFPVHPGLVDTLAARAGAGPLERDATVAHVLATCAGYAYADLDTVATMMARVGFDAEACVRVSQTVDAMFIYSTAFLLQSRCGRVVILCYRGTETTNIGNWLGDADVGSESSLLSPGQGLPPVRVHAGFHLNVRATWWTVLEELSRAIRGGSLLYPDRAVEFPLQSLYVTGHSLGGAMALLFALAVSGGSKHRPVGDALRAVYTYGQPMAVCEPLPRWTDEVAHKVVRHVIPKDPVPALPPAAWGPFVHIGQEYRLEEEAWRRSNSRFVASEHVPHRYIAALRPAGKITELGD